MQLVESSCVSNARHAVDRISRVQSGAMAREGTKFYLLMLLQ